MSAGLNMHPVMICGEGHWAEVPCDPGAGVTGPIHCGECGARMSLCTVGTLEREPDFATVNYLARRGDRTWWM